MVTQFIAAFDDIVIGRYNKNRQEVDQINVRYVYAPKERVMYDIINENKTLTLPVVAVSIKSVSRDTSRVFNKLDGFYYSGTSGEERTSKHIKAPVPVNINLGVSVLSRYQTDMDQILSNFIPFSNPYVVISWKVPEKFKLSVDQEIRSEVLWDGNVSLNYPTELNASQKARITADTSFTIKGWLFKDEDDPVGNIFYIDQNFTAVDLISDYEGLSGVNAPTESFELSGSPTLTDIFYNGVRLTSDTSVKRQLNVLTPLQQGTIGADGTTVTISNLSGVNTSATHVRVTGSTVERYDGIFPVNTISSTEITYLVSGPIGTGITCNVEAGSEPSAPGTIILNGTSLGNTENVFFSSTNESLYTSLTSKAFGEGRGLSITTPFSIDYDDGVTGTADIQYDGSYLGENQYDYAQDVAAGDSVTMTVDVAQAIGDPRMQILMFNPNDNSQYWASSDSVDLVFGSNTLSWGPFSDNVHLKFTVLLDSDDAITFNTFNVSDGSKIPTRISGQSIPFTIVNDNTITFPMPDLGGGTGLIRFIPYNVAGFSFSDTTTYPLDPRVYTVSVDSSTNSAREGLYAYQNPSDTYEYGHYTNTSNTATNIIYWTGSRWGWITEFGFGGSSNPSFLDPSVSEQDGWWSSSYSDWDNGNVVFEGSETATFSAGPVEIKSSSTFIKLVN